MLGTLSEIVGERQKICNRMRYKHRGISIVYEEQSFVLAVIAVIGILITIFLCLYSEWGEKRGKEREYKKQIKKLMSELEKIKTFNNLEQMVI